MPGPSPTTSPTDPIRTRRRRKWARCTACHEHHDGARSTGHAAPLTRYAPVYCAARYITVVAVVVAVGVRSRQACARRRIPIPDRRVVAAARELLAVGTEAHGSDDGRMPPQGGPKRGPRCCVIEPDRACIIKSTVASCDEAAVRRESHTIHLPLRGHKTFSPVCAQMKCMRPSESPAAMTSPKPGPYCTH